MSSICTFSRCSALCGCCLTPVPICFMFINNLVIYYAISATLFFQPGVKTHYFMLANYLQDFFFFFSIFHRLSPVISCYPNTDKTFFSFSIFHRLLRMHLLEWPKSSVWRQVPARSDHFPIYQQNLLLCIL